MKKEYKYHHFENFIIRTPSFNFNAVELSNLNQEKILNFFISNQFFRESIFLASETLYNEVNKSIEKGFCDAKLINSLVKYYIRSKTRCTPFGLFAGCTYGTIGIESTVILKNKIQFRRHTRLDMELVSILSNYLSSLPELQKQIKFYTNNTLYPISDFYSYIESKIVDKSKTYYKSTAEYTEYLSSILDFCDKGKFFKEIVAYLQEMDFEEEDSIEYISELIQSQILTSDWEISTLDSNPFKTLMQKLNSIQLNSNPQLSSFIKQSKKLIEEFSHERKSGNFISQMQKESNLFSFLEHNARNIFQTDLQTFTKNNALSEKTVKKVGNAIEVIRCFSPGSEISALEKFKQRFLKKYDGEEVPLLEVLDEDFGLGYPFLEDKLLAPLLDQIKFPKKPESKKIQWDKKDALLAKKLSEFYLNSFENEKNLIEITDKDIKFLRSEITLNQPSTLSAMVEIYQEEGKEKVYITGFAPSAAKLLGRFSYFDEKFEKITKEIIDKEAKYLDDETILAEIVHLPEAKDGNVILRPQLTDYEIPLLSQSLLPADKQIQLKDLLLLVEDDRLILKSRKINKKIIPLLSSAHNSGSSKNLSIYKFLADFQYQNIERNFQFSWGVIGKDFKYLPRIVYKDIILSKAFWNISKDDLDFVLKNDDKKLLNEKILKFRTKNKIPFIAVIKDADNKLYIDFRNEILVDLFISIVKKHEKIILEEVLFSDSNLFVKNEKGELFTNEFIINFYKEL